MSEDTEIERDEKPLPPGYTKRGNKIFYRDLDMLEIVDKDPNLHYRYINTANDRNVDKRLAQGYEFVDKTTGGLAKSKAGDKDKARARKAMGTGTEIRELRLAAIPNELYEARREHVRQKTANQMAQVRNQIQQNVPGASGTITIKKE